MFFDNVEDWGLAVEDWGREFFVYIYSTSYQRFDRGLYLVTLVCGDDLSCYQNVFGAFILVATPFSKFVHYLCIVRPCIPICEIQRLVLRILFQSMAENYLHFPITAASMVLHNP